jgi:PHD/YefM family antitoxin component YafN of YafNO toxin-antitoxin module
MTALHPQFVTDPEGNRLSVLLPLAEYEALIERLEDLEDLEDARAVLARVERGEEDTIPWETVKAEMGIG